MAFCQPLLASPHVRGKKALVTPALKTISVPLDQVTLEEEAVNMLLSQICEKTDTHGSCKLEDMFFVISFYGKWRNCLHAARLAWRNLTSNPNTHVGSLFNEPKKAAILQHHGQLASNPRQIIEIPLEQLSLDQEHVHLFVEKICYETNTQISIEQEEGFLKLSIFGNQPECTASASLIALNFGINGKASHRSSETNNGRRSPYQEPQAREEIIGKCSQSTPSSSSSLEQLKKTGYAILSLLAVMDLNEVDFETKLLLAKINAATESWN